MITLAVPSVFSPRIGRSLALSRPWSHSTRLFAYCPVLWNAPGSSSPMTCLRAAARSVTTSSGASCSLSEAVKNLRAAPMSRRDVHVDHLAVLVDRPVHVAPNAADLHIGLVDEPSATHRVPARSGR